jgi:hypothetical protein
LAKCKVPDFAKDATSGKLAPLLATEAIEHQFDIGGSQRRVA